MLKSDQVSSWRRLALVCEVGAGEAAGSKRRCIRYSGVAAFDRPICPTVWIVSRIAAISRSSDMREGLSRLSTYRSAISGWRTGVHSKRYRLNN
jgi:hypothetical protein